ncbi:PolC-type DNA polymerase III [Treponema sp.]|uniref:3'-5' exonuclease n=1 Tax=Treponema sp. TaxID=166 RepID=UPI00388FBF14
MGSNIKILTDNKRTVRDFFEKDYTYVAVDTETTGLHPKENFLIEIGAVKFNRYGLLDEPFDILIKPPVEIPMYITQLTGIDDFMVSKSPTAAEAIERFKEYCGGKDTILIAHNAPFDIHFIDAELERIGQPKLEHQVIDTLVMTRAFHPDFKGTEEGAYRLQSLANRYGINVLQAHRANDDARVCMELFKHLVLEKKENTDIKTLAMLALNS